MRVTYKTLIIFCLRNAAFIAAIILPTIANAQTQIPTAQFLLQEDRNGDGRLDWASWRANFQNQLIQITVYDKGQNMVQASSWQDAVDFDNDTWLFDRDADGLVELVIQFHQDADGKRQALLWDDQNGDGRVSVEEEKGILYILESNFPTLIVSAPDDWLQPDGHINSQLMFEYDGPDARGSGSLPAPLLQLFANDGQPDFREELVDTDRDGIIDYTHSQVLTKLDSTQYGIPLDGVRANIRKISYRFNQPFLYWPLLNYDASESIQNYFDTPPFVSVDWTNARIDRYGITGYPIEHGYHINNLNPWQPGEINQATFENSMSYYDLAEDLDRLPELHIRQVYWPNFGSPVIPNPSVPVNEVRYSWLLRSVDDLDWDFGLSLTGSNPITTTVKFGDYPVQIVPYANLPNWVVSRTWLNATLVANEGRHYKSSEGIYEWSTSGGIENDISLPIGDPGREVEGSRAEQDKCILGGGSCDFSEYYTDIGIKLRAEYAPLNDLVFLYRSPVDRRLHLQNATLGIWRQDSQNRILYADASGDGYVDLWQHERDGEITSSLLLTSQGLILARDGEVKLKSISLPPLDYQSPPPVDHQSWQVMRDALLPDFEAQPASLQAMFDQFSGEVSTLHGASVGPAQAGGAELAFSLQLSPGFGFEGQPWLDLAEAAPGDYLVTSSDHFDTQPLVTGQLSLEVASIDQGLKVGEMAGVPVVVTNPGAQASEDVSLAVYAVQGERVQPVARQALHIPASQVKQIIVSWQPASGGKWDLLVNLEDAEGQVLASQMESVQVAGDEHTVLGLTLQPQSLALALLGLAGLGIFLVVMVWRLLKPVPTRLQ